MAGRYLAAFLLLLVCDASLAAKNDWAQGTAGQADGATGDYYNRAGLLEWTHGMGDWRDAANVAQGEREYTTTSVIDNDTHPSPHDQHLFIDNVLIANKYIGPWRGAERP